MAVVKRRQAPSITGKGMPNKNQENNVDKKEITGEAVEVESQMLLDTIQA